MGLVLNGEAGKGFANNYAHIERMARSFLNSAAHAVSDSYMTRVLQDYISCLIKRDYLLQISKRYVLFNLDKLTRIFKWNDFAVMSLQQIVATTAVNRIGHSIRIFQSPVYNSQIELRPLEIHVTMKKL